MQASVSSLLDPVNEDDVDDDDDDDDDMMPMTRRIRSNQAANGASFSISNKKDGMMEIEMVRV
jgi:hypothetical protein